MLPPGVTTNMRDSELKIGRVLGILQVYTVSTGIPTSSEYGRDVDVHYRIVGLPLSIRIRERIRIRHSPGSRPCRNRLARKLEGIRKKREPQYTY
jgi:hypothetical protein